MLRTTPPPVILLLTLAVGAGMQALYPVALGEYPWFDYVGWGLIVVGIVLMPPILLRFRRSQTAFDVRRKPTALVVSGPYRFSRNPGYLALCLAYVGIAIVLDNAWMIILAVPAIVVIDVCVIRNEEQQLEDAFGEEYRSYKASVRRWF